MSTIVILIDQEPKRRRVARLLTRNGHDVVFADDETRSVESLGREPLSVFLIDVLTPELDAFDIVRWLRMQGGALRRTPVVMFLPGGVPEDLGDLAERYGVSRLLSDDCDDDAIVTAVEEAAAHDVPHREWPGPLEFSLDHLRLLTCKLSRRLRLVVPELAEVLGVPPNPVLDEPRGGTHFA